MSLGLSLVDGLITRASIILPKISASSIGISLKRLPQVHEQVAEVDPRLIELGEQLAESGQSAPPFFIDNGLLKAAPKKKVSHQKKRQKWLAPGNKQLKFLHHLNRCPTCGAYKRSHHVCMSCFTQIRNYWKTQAGKPEVYKEEFANERDESILYPGKVERDAERKLRKKEYLVNRHKTLPVEREEK